MDDTSMNLPETRATLLAQQLRLMEGRRAAQMFPVGTEELPLPSGFVRTETPRGVFHHSMALPSAVVKSLSAACRENEILGLGPYSKGDILRRFAQGDPLIVVTERTPAGVELRAAVGTHGTMREQVDYFVATSSDENEIRVETIKNVLQHRAPR